MLSSLIALCPPPGPTVRVDWARAEELLGVALPDDYKALAEAYGVGWFSQWLMADLPDSPYPQFDLLHDAQDTEWRRSGRDHRPGTILYAFHPEPSGLIRWGHSRAADDLWWLPVTDDPASWRIVACDDEGGHWAEFGCTTSQFIYRLLTQQLQLPWSDRRAQQPPSFAPMPVPPGFDWDPRPEGLLRQPDPVATRDGWQAIIRAAPAGRVDPASVRTHPSGHPVPVDYLELLAAHGPGAYAGLAVAPAAELPALGAPVTDRQRRLRGGEHFIPAHFHPEPGGLIPWGELPDGDACCWYPAGRDPGTWPVVVCSRDGAGWQRYDLSTTAFVCEWLAGRVRPAYRTAPRAPLSERLDRLAEVLGAGDANWIVDWRAVEAELEVGLPADYRAFVERFGAGSVNQELYIVVPSAPLPRFDLIAGNAGRAKARRLLHQESSQYRPDSPCPPPGWLLVWGKTNTRARLYWRTDGLAPDTWPVVLYDEVDWIDCGSGFLDVLFDHLTDRAPQGMIGFSPAWPPRWQPMRAAT